MTCCRTIVAITSVLLLTALETTARMRYIDAARGNDINDGSAPVSAWLTLQHAANQVEAGDTVLVAPGVYRGAMQLRAKGTARKPITFQAMVIGEGRVVITNAHNGIRANEVKWKVEDAALGLYSAPYSGDAPARVLAGGVDLFPYVDVEHLKTFTTANSAPGPRHGYALSPVSHALYVRLHASGKYGPVDPNRQLMAVAPPTGTHREGTLIGAPQHYGIGILNPGDAHVIIDGFTFEAPGVAGVYTEANHVIVRRSWFRGCRTGVSGNYLDSFTTDPTGEDYFSLRLDPIARQHSAADVTVEYCDYSQFPAYDDALDVLQEPGVRGSVDRDFLIYWSRKSSGGLPSERFKYEIGIASRIGRNWTVRRNYVHDAFEGLSCHAVWASDGLRVEENCFERLLDNGVETEDHAANMYIWRNVFIDTLEPFSFQPLRGMPWPGPIYFVQNIIINNPERIDVWLPPRPFPRGAFKIGIKTETWERNPHLRGEPRPKRFILPEPGIVIAHNTVLFPGGRLITPQGDIDIPIEGVKFLNNVLAADYLVDPKPGKSGLPSGHFLFANNAVVPAMSGQPGPGEIPAENGGRRFAEIDALKFGKNLRPRADSPLRNAAIPVPEAGLALPDLGAVQPGDTWYPLSVGPLAAEEAKARGELP